MIVPKWLKMAQYDSKTSKTLPKWSKMPQHALKWTKNGQKRLKMTKKRPKKARKRILFFYWIELTQNNFELNIFLNWILTISFELEIELNHFWQFSFESKIELNHFQQFSFESKIELNHFRVKFNHWLNRQIVPPRANLNSLIWVLLWWLENVVASQFGSFTIAQNIPMRCHGWFVSSRMFAG